MAEIEASMIEDYQTPFLKREMGVFYCECLSWGFKE
jgi:hypothetical protein